jgi:hypothetical protein
MRAIAFAALALAVALPVAAQASGDGLKIGVLQNGVFHHDLTGVEFAVPPEWSIVNEVPTTEGGGQTVVLRDSLSNVTVAVWLKRQNIDPATIPSVLDRRPEVKLMQRNNFVSYRYRPESIQHTTIGGQQALTAIADYVSHQGKMVEYLTWIYSPTAHVAFTARVPVSDLANLQSRFDPIIQSIVFP